MSFRTTLTIVAGLAVLAGCGQPSAPAAAVSTSTPTSAGPVSATPASAVATAGPAQPGLAEDLTFTGLLSGHVSTATPTGDCGVKSAGGGRTFQGTIDFALSDGIHGFRLTWIIEQPPGTVPGALPGNISITPAGSPGGFATAAALHAPTATFKLAADEHGGTINGDYIKGPPPPPFAGVSQPPARGHLSGIWRCA